jgi:hypothetical protein
VETYIRNIQKEEIKKIIEINKKHEEEEREKDSIREEKKKIDSFAYYEDPIMTSQGIIIQQENVDSHYKQLNKEKRKELIKNGKHKKKVKITVFKNVRVI